jgi:hypothetical protein
MFYRVAIRADVTAPWQWRSTLLSSQSALFAFLRQYQAIPLDRLQVFSSTTREDLDVQLTQANKELEAHAARPVTASLSHQTNRMSGSQDTNAASVKSGESNAMAYDENTNALEKKRFELEMGEGGDHDVPYLFTLPLSTPQMLTWIQLRARTLSGELAEL